MKRADGRAVGSVCLVHLGRRLHRLRIYVDDGVKRRPLQVVSLDPVEIESGQLRAGHLTACERRVNVENLPGDRWPGTTGLYVAQVELEAPAAEGLYTWSVRSLGSDAEIPHGEGSVSFGVRVVSHPESVRVETVDQASQAPLSGARVVMHPYKAVTDERGIAEVRVANGANKLFVSQSRYLTFGLAVEVDADMTTRAELSVEPVQERN